MLNYQVIKFTNCHSHQCSHQKSSLPSLITSFQLTVLWPCSTWWRIRTKWRTRCWRCVCFHALSPRTAIYSEREGGKTWSWNKKQKDRDWVLEWEQSQRSLQFVSRTVFLCCISLNREFSHSCTWHTLIIVVHLYDCCAQFCCQKAMCIA